ncbi:type II toxin-antitoxin system ParD family antitoxin [Brevundimonas sp.]|uniref:type II toxin-antitoxin system ParD family antitoxin n=1 Tax=Brevundimonas sp. TaxID=1871086 RepID=UPI0022BD216E|nr:type II toxin-antitoxin system ParD family antitoxin [Brevundimonas sp.]MCZ8193121.1 type II toxin-antitoxin system ParD family antitoxin [Brevundimonas sp.]
MATMNISLPAQMKAWVESRSADGRYANASDYVRDLIRRDQVRTEKIAHLRILIDEAEASGLNDQTPREVIEELRTELRRSA